MKTGHVRKVRQTEKDVFKKYGLKVGSIIVSNYGQNYFITQISPLGFARLPILKGHIINKTLKLISPLLIINPEVKNGEYNIVK